ncbi:MAG: prepilin-type N-terminal cleavage/methylation domain-containing protein [Methylococcales bacterium]|nr:prepilin-type N-terminal cleavage/methylation domain-containing protein [Methylococcales bacterium]MCK5926413.1 prepilin-type N-terminal cleavage/methylation domain-containing protein [Methylococcales bacterium]
MNQPRKSRLLGFTLIEVLIALSLLSIMMLMLFAGLRISAKSWDKGDAKLIQINNMSAVHNFFHNQMATALPLWDDFTELEKKFSFQGTENTLQFVSTLPSSSKRLGLQVFNLRLEKNQLWVAIKPFYPSLEQNKWKIEDVVLLDKIATFKITYFGKQEEDVLEWQDDWVHKHLPQLIAIDIETIAEIKWPQIILKLHNHENKPKPDNPFEKARKKLTPQIGEDRDDDDPSPF